MRRFRVQFSTDGETKDIAIVDLDERIFRQVDDAWRSQFYPLWAAEDIAAHIAYNLCYNGLRLSQMNGWEAMLDTYAIVRAYPNLLTRWSVTAQEISLHTLSVGQE